VCSSDLGIGAALGVELFHRFEQGRYHFARIPFNGYFGGIVGAEYLWVNINMDQIFRHFHAEAAGGDFSKTSTHGKHSIALSKRLLCSRYGITTKTHARMQRVVAWEGA